MKYLKVTGSTETDRHDLQVSSSESGSTFSENISKNNPALRILGYEKFPTCFTYAYRIYELHDIKKLSWTPEIPPEVLISQTLRINIRHNKRREREFMK